jgi:hypothetical protein
MSSVESMRLATHEPRYAFLGGVSAALGTAG